MRAPHLILSEYEAATQSLQATKPGFQSRIRFGFIRSNGNGLEMFRFAQQDSTIGYMTSNS
jgi:hypothetical protein